MKRFLSTVIAFALVLGLMPTFAFAAEPTAVNFIFYDELDRISVNAAKDVASTTWKNAVTVAEESSTYVGDRREYSAGGRYYPQFDLGTGSATWISSNNSSSRKWTFKIPITAAGWYNIDFLGSYWYANDVFYIYVDDQYAGIYDFNNGLVKEEDVSIHLGDKKQMNTLYLTPDEDGYVKIMLAFAKSCGYGKARVAPIELNLIPAEKQEKVTCVDIVHTFPEVVEFGRSVKISAYAVMSDGTMRRINGYKADATADAGNAISVQGEGSGIAVSRSSNPLYDNGMFEGTVTGYAEGENKVKLSVMVDGEEYSEEATINVVPATAQFQFKLGLSANDFIVNEVAGEYGKPADWKIVGAEIVPEKTTEGTSRRYHYSYGDFNQLYTANSHSIWPNSNNSRDLQITLRKIVPFAGYYDIDFTGYTWNLCSDYSIYINGEYVGDTNCYDPTGVIANGVIKTTRLNKLYLPAGAAEISFRARKAHYSSGAMFFTPKDMLFTPATVAEIAVSEVEINEIPETMAAGEKFDGTAKALMSDGCYRSFGYNDDGKLPTTDNVIKVSSSNPAVVAVTDVECVKVLTTAENVDVALTIDPTTTTYKLNALRAGEADITVTAIVDGKEKSTTTKITVTGEAMEETITKTGASVYISADEGGSVVTSLENIIDNVEFGKAVEAEATANEGYKFAYWKNSNGNVISTNAKETFVINTNTSIKAYFEKVVSESDAKAPVYFYNGNGALIEKRDAEKGSLFSAVKPQKNPSLTGFAFDCWSIADGETINDVTRAVALFKDSDNTYTVSVEDATSTSYTGKKYGDTVTVTANGPDTFSCWMIGDDIVSYDKSFTFDVYGDMKLTAVYGAELEKVPTVALEEIDGSYFLTYSVPAGFTKLEAGILFSMTGTPRVGASYSKAIERTGSGQFTAMPLGENDNIARGYVMFKDKDNNIKVIYAD